MVSGRKQITFVFSFLLIVLLAGCGSEIERVHFEAVGEEEATFQSDGSEVAFWTDLDVEYAYGSEPSATYEITVYKKGDKVAELVCDPFDVRYQTMERHAEVRGTVKQSYLAPMRCTGELPEGELTLKVHFKVNARMTVFRADLVLREAGN